MEDNAWSWHDDKARKNAREHGATFEQAKAVFRDLAASERDSQPMTAEERKSARRVPRIKTMRQAMNLTQEAFAERYMIPLGTLRAWEQGAVEPDAAGKAYIRAIMGDPVAVAKALRNIPAPPAE